MSVFAPRFYNEPSFNGLFRLIDDFDKYASESSGDTANNKTGGLTGRTQLPTFTPKFDLKETETAYELHGDLPGIAKENVHLEFTNDHTLRISGKVERSYTSGDNESASAEGKPASDGEEKSESTEVAKTTTDDRDKKQVSASAPRVKYWVSERSVGEFARSFNFASHVDSEAISARLENGVLNVVVPKAKKPEGRRIAIQ